MFLGAPVDSVIQDRRGQRLRTVDCHTLEQPFTTERLKRIAMGCHTWPVLRALAQASFFFSPFPLRQPHQPPHSSHRFTQPNDCILAQSRQCHYFTTQHSVRKVQDAFHNAKPPPARRRYHAPRLQVHQPRELDNSSEGYFQGVVGGKRVHPLQRSRCKICLCLSLLSCGCKELSLTIPSITGYIFRAHANRLRARFQPRIT